jgi:hypothetical protein
MKAKEQRKIDASSKRRGGGRTVFPAAMAFDFMDIKAS